MPILANSSDAPFTQVNDGLGSYTQLIAVFLCGTFAFLDLYCVQPLLPLFSQVFHTSATHVGLTISASTLGVAISATLLALFGEVLDRKRTIVLCMGLLGVCTLLTATSTTLNTLAAWRLLQGLLTPGIFIVTMGYLTEEWPAMHVPRVMSTYMAGSIFGGFLGRLLGGLVASQTGWRSVFLVLGVIILLGTPIIQRLLAPSRPRLAAPQRGSVLSPLLANLRNPRLLANFGIGFCLGFALISVFSFITFYLAAAPFNLSTAALSWILAVYLVSVLTTLAAGTMLARIGLRRGMLTVIVICFAGEGLTLVHSLAPIALGLAIISAGILIAQTCASSFLREAAPLGARVSAIGIYICSYYIGGTAGGQLPGIAWRHAGWPGCVALTCGFLIIAALTALFGWSGHTPEPDAIPL